MRPPFLGAIRACRPSNRINACVQTRKMSSLVSWEVDETARVGMITLNSSETYNALSVDMGREFESLVRNICEDMRDGASNKTSPSASRVNAIVLKGAGDNAFSAGGNLEWLHSLRENSVHRNVDLMLQFYHSFLSVRQLPVPVVAALQGPAMGAGACLSLACDLRVAASHKKAILGFPFSKLGISTGMGCSWLLRNAGVPTAKVNEILMTGQTLSGEDAFDLGLVNRLANGDAKEEAYTLACEVAQQHPVAIRSMVQTLRLDEGLEATLQREAFQQATCYNRQDWGRGVDAIAEKRSANFDDYFSK